MGKQFDELSKALASGVSRREALKRFAGGVAVALAAAVPGRAAATTPPRTCLELCRQLYPSGPERGLCIKRSSYCPQGQCSPYELNQGQYMCMPISNFM